MFARGYGGYGNCRCGGPLLPEWFREYEKDVTGHKTGRSRIACSRLVCDCCGNIYTVDDSFDGPWESPSKSRKQNPMASF